MLEEITAHAAHILSVVQGTKPGASPEASIARSWIRCVNNYGLDAGHSHQTQVLEQIRLREHQERLDDFLEIAQFEMNSLYQRIAGSGFAVILTDCDGVIVNWICDANRTICWRCWISLRSVRRIPNKASFIPSRWLP